MRVARWLVVIGVMATLACSSTIHHNALVGFVEGKKAFKLDYRLSKYTFEDNSKGYLLENLQHYAVGSVSNRKIQRKAWLDERFSLRLTESHRTVNEDRTFVRTLVRGERVHTVIQQGPNTLDEFMFQHQGPLYIELHPLMYANDLTEPGQEKTYMCLDEENGKVLPARVRYVGLEKIYEGGKAHQADHYQLEAITQPGSFDDYYLDPKSKDILRIQFGKIKFIPAAWVD